MKIALARGDCLEWLRGYPVSSVDAIVTDPPYGLDFMGREWDHGVPGRPFWEAVHRVAKPGAHLVAFGGTRTFHRLACSMEDAGWEIRDCLSWLYGSGFPKSLNVQQAINKAARGFPQGGADPDSPNHGKFKGGCSEESPSGRGFGAGAGQFMDEPGAGRGGDEGPWQGWGTALKPAWEPILLARKPLDGTVAGNLLRHEVGGLDINGCRIPADDSAYAKNFSGDRGAPQHREEKGSTSLRPGGGSNQGLGRWPANVVLDEEAALRLDAEAGARGSFLPPGKKYAAGMNGVVYGKSTEHTTESYGDSGGPSRFFYCAKASRSEREEGLDHLEPRRRTDGREAIDGPGADNPRLRSSERRNDHPTVKPVDLMRWLVRLVTPAQGIVLDPFAGSGTTGVACALEGRSFLGIEMDEHYCEIARGRIRAGLTRAALAAAGEEPR